MAATGVKREIAAIDGQQCTRDKSGSIGCQEDCWTNDVISFADAIHRYALEQMRHQSGIGLRVLEPALDRRRPHLHREQGVDTNAMLRPFHRKLTRHLVYAGFGNAIDKIATTQR